MTVDKAATSVLIGLLVLLAIAVGPWICLAAYLELFGVLTDGEVTARGESVVIRGDHWHYDLVVSYRYQIAGSSQPATAAQRVDTALYDRLPIGSRVKVRYSRWAPLRSFGSAGVSLADARWYSRLVNESYDAQWLLEMELYAIVAVVCYLAYRRKSRPLGMIAIVAVASVGAGVLLFGFLIFPLLLLVWWRRPGQGYGSVLLASIVVSSVILVWRIPWPTVQPAGRLVRATAAVRQVHDVESVWGTKRFPGQPLRQPFQILDLEFTPKGSRDTVHAIDRIDSGSVPGLAKGAAVAVEYPEKQARAARLAGGKRTYAWDLLVYVLGLSYGTGALLMLLGWPIARVLRKIGRNMIIRPEQVASRFASLPAGDPRRRAVEARVAPRVDAAQPRDPGPTS